AGDANVHDHGCERFVFAVGEGGDGSGECEGAGVGDDHARVSATAAGGAAGSVLDTDGEGVQLGRAIGMMCWAVGVRKVRRPRELIPWAFGLFDGALNYGIAWKRPMVIPTA